MRLPGTLASDHAAARVRVLCDTVRAARAARAAEQARRVNALAGVGRRWLLHGAVQVRAALVERIREVERRGQIPSLFTLTGTSYRERSYNTVLAWVFDPAAGHGAGRVALEAFAAHLGLTELARDARTRDAPITVRGELAWPAEAQSNRMPDLLVLSPSTTLLVENKVLAEESGEGQYEDYLDALETLAKARGTTHAAWLAAPRRRPVPTFEEGTRAWNGCLTHPELAAVLGGAAADPRMTAWGRVVCLLVAEQLASPHGREAPVAEARALLDRVGETPDLASLTQMRQLLARLTAAEPPALEGMP
ncbi:MAG: PD-(D/E)XK nuclease family protein [Myxococcota bacterium]